MTYYAMCEYRNNGDVFTEEVQASSIQEAYRKVLVDFIHRPRWERRNVRSLMVVDNEDLEQCTECISAGKEVLG